MLIQHKKGGVFLPKYKINFPKGEAVDVPEHIAEKVLRNPDFFRAGEKPEKKSDEKKGGKKK